MPGDANAILINKTNLDSGTDGTGSGSDPTASGGAELNLEEEAEVAFCAFYSVSDTGGEPGDADTLAVVVQAAPDGTNYGTLATFRSVLGSEMPDDTAAGDASLRLAIVARIPRSTVDGTFTVPVRLSTTASDGSNWGLYVDVRTVADVRSEWLANAIEA